MNRTAENCKYSKQAMTKNLSENYVRIYACVGPAKNYVKTCDRMHIEVPMHLIYIRKI